MSMLAEARAKLREQLDWRGPGGRPQGILTLTRAEAEAVLAGPTEPVAVLDEIARLATLFTKEQVESYADASGMKPTNAESHQSKGGRARAAALSPDMRKEIAKTAATARWARLTPKP